MPTRNAFIFPARRINAVVLQPNESPLSLDLPLLRSGFALVPERKPDQTDRFHEIPFEQRPQTKALLGQNSDRAQSDILATKVGGHDWTPEPAGTWTDAFGAIAGRMPWPAAP